MRVRHVVLCLALTSMMVTATPHTVAAAAAKPSISIITPRGGAIVHGSSVTIQVQLHDFTLVPPTLLSPARWKSIPLLKGNRGHIHYVLDTLANLVLTRDVTTMTHHTWTNVSPGQHTITAYLATSQHAPFPGARAATIHITVARPAAPAIPSIKITRLGYRHIGRGMALEAHVAVSRFTLVPPVFYNPPKLPGHQGHIHYVLDSINNFRATRDAATALMHPWMGVSPGRHTILAYLATSQHQLFPGTRPARATITIPGLHATTKTIGILTLLPGTGGGAGREEPSLIPALPALCGTILTCVGVAVRRRRRP